MLLALETTFTVVCFKSNKGETYLESTVCEFEKEQSARAVLVEARSRKTKQNKLD